MNTRNVDIRVLIVDDETLLTKIIEKHLLVEGGYVTRVEHKSTSAAQSALEFMPDIILLDIVMPEMDGHAVAEAIRKQPETADIPILHISAMTSSRFTLGNLTKTESGYFLAKPFMRKDLLEAIRITLEDPVEA